MKNVPVKTKLFIGRTFKVLLLRARVRWQALISFLCGPLRWPMGLRLLVLSLQGFWDLEAWAFCIWDVCLICSFL